MIIQVFKICTAGCMLWSTQFDTPDRVSALRPSSTYEILEQCIEFGNISAQTANSTGGNTQFVTCYVEWKKAPPEWQSTPQ